jgi:hypothetical protein
MKMEEEFTRKGMWLEDPRSWKRHQEMESYLQLLEECISANTLLLIQWDSF